ncbi:hypothetical protein MY4824_003946 [Beauveria thailandica]
MSNRQLLGQWQVFMMWTERPDLEPPCNLHSSLLFIRGEENIICHVVPDQERYTFGLIFQYEFTDPYRVLSVHPLCFLQVFIDAHTLIRTLIEVHRPTLAQDPEYSCKKWVNEVLFKFNLRDWITHGDWRHACDCQSSIETNTVARCHVGGRGET